MRRGFKAEAERLATQVRTEIGIGPYKPLDIDALADHVGAQLRAADELTSLTKLQELEELQPGAFSACTFDFGTRKVIVISPLASPNGSAATPATKHPTCSWSITSRRSSNSAACPSSPATRTRNKKRTGSPAASCSPATCSRAHSNEALTPRPSPRQTAVSLQMANFRLRATGAERQAAVWPRY